MKMEKSVTGDKRVSSHKCDMTQVGRRTKILFAVWSNSTQLLKILLDRKDVIDKDRPKR